MESVISIVLTAAAVGAGLVFLAVGAFSLVSLLFDDLLESDRGAEEQVPGLEEAA